VDVLSPTLSPGERIVTFLVAAVGYHIIVGWPEWLLWRSHLMGRPAWTSTGRVALLWGALVAAVLLPLAAGWLSGRLWGGARRDAWLHALSTSGECYIRVHMKEGVLARLFGPRSLASIGQRRDLYLARIFQKRWGSEGSTIRARALVARDSDGVEAPEPKSRRALAR